MNFNYFCSLFKLFTIMNIVTKVLEWSVVSIQMVINVYNV